MKRHKTVNGLATGMYRVSAKPVKRTRDGRMAVPEGKPYRFRVRRDRVATAEFAYRQQPAPNVSGTVVDPRGRPIAGLPICDIDLRKTRTSVDCLTTTKRDGSFAVHFEAWSDIGQGHNYLSVGDPFRDSPWASQEAVNGVNTLAPRGYAEGILTGDVHGALADKEVCVTPWAFSAMAGLNHRGERMCDRTDESGRASV